MQVSLSDGAPAKPAGFVGWFTRPFDQAIARLPDYLTAPLTRLPEDLRTRATEIRMRAGGAVTLTLPEGPQFLLASGRTASLPREDCLRLTGAQLAQILRALCEYSVHSYTEDIARGYLTLPGGHRAGVCGTAVTERGVVIAVRDISSVNLRIAREVHGAASDICARLFRDGHLPGLLISGPPGSGKTTLLRDLARRLSDGLCGPCRRVALIDERGELAGACQSAPCCAVGANTDVLTGYPKGEGILLAIRSLAPEIILCDELGGEADAAALEAGFHSGVRFVATLHAGSAEEALARPAARRLLARNAFDALVQLEFPCEIAEIRAFEMRNENAECRNC
ncbi:MAG: Flp pilus assembly complex ATPase component TadA [Firmicutes bacterium]|nr:Flp pilus assembly complex ATPase component TadA [Bacillota bacterium]